MAKPRKTPLIMLALVLLLSAAWAVGDIKLPDGVFSRTTEIAVLNYSLVNDHQIRATYASGPTADIVFSVENPAGNPVNPNSILGYQMVTQASKYDGLKYGYRLRLPNQNFKGIIEVTCNENLSAELKCGQMSFEFEDLEREHNLTGKVQAFNASTTQMSETQFKVEMTLLEVLPKIRTSGLNRKHTGNDAAQTEQTDAPEILRRV